MSEKKVFISYRRDATGKSFARSIKEALTQRGYDVFLDVDSMDSGEWATQILTEVPKHAHFLLLLTPGALDRCADAGDWVRREFLKAVETKRNIVPVREESINLGDERNNCPEPMKKVFDLQIATIQHASFKNSIEELIQRYIPPHKAPAETPLPKQEPVPVKTDITRIIKYAPEQLIGRESEFALLNDVWNKVVNQQPNRPHVLSFVALGGEGKTSLVTKWVIDELASKDWPGCAAVFAWSFYSQGTKEQVAANSELFLKEALLFFGDEEDKALAESSAGAHDKGKRLADMIREGQNLLVLDGLEPLQYAPTSPLPGELKDQGIAALLKTLATSNRGLCIVTTRYTITDLKAFKQNTAPEELLKRLSNKAGVALLEILGVTGAVKDKEQLVEEVKGHALTLQIMGSFLKRAHKGDIRRRDRVKFEKADQQVDGGHAFRAMDAYVRWMENESPEAKRELAILRIMGLFDRPATYDCIKALLKEPVITGLTEPLIHIAEEDWWLSIDALETARLLTAIKDGSGELLALDTHPHIREYFAQQLREKNPETWRAAHKRLYEYLCENTKEGDTPTLEDLQPLYQAVAHGCFAGLQQEACDEIYLNRISRGTGIGGFYSTNILGAFGSDLGAIACFFEQPWTHIHPIISEEDKAWLLNQAAYRLRALGRLTEALEPMRAGLAMYIKQKDLKNAAIVANNISELELTLGNVAGSIKNAKLSVEYADKSEDAFERMSDRTTHASALHQAGELAKAESIFLEAEQIQVERQPGYPLLYSLPGFLYCDLLLATTERVTWKKVIKEFGLLRQTQTNIDSLVSKSDQTDLLTTIQVISQRATETRKIAERNNWLLDIALDHLTLGRATLYHAILEEAKTEPAASELNTAVDGLRRSGNLHHLPRALLSRAWCRFIAGQKTRNNSSQSDLDEAWEIAERGPMRLFMADIHLYRAGLFFREENYPWNKHEDGSPRGPKDDLTAAEKLINDCGYHRRDEELADAKRVILGQ